MQLHFQGEGRCRHEALDLGLAHLLHRHELHVAGDHRNHGGDEVVGITQAAEDGLGHDGTLRVVAVEADAADGFVEGLGRGLGDVVEQHGEAQFQRGVRRQHPEHDAGVGVHIAFRMPFRGLLTADHRQHFRHNVAHQPGIHQQLHALGPPRRGQDLRKLVANAFGRNSG